MERLVAALKRDLDRAKGIRTSEHGVAIDQKLSVDRVTAAQARRDPARPVE